MATAPKKKTEPATTAAEAAVLEAVDPTSPFVVPFRGVDFKIERGILDDARFRMALAAMQNHQIMYEALGPDNSTQFISLLKRGETIDAVAAEFFESLNTAAGWGNSSTSRRS